MGHYGCSFMLDGLSDRKGMALINFLVNSPCGTIFLSSINTFDEIKAGHWMFEIPSEQIKLIGLRKLSKLLKIVFLVLNLHVKIMHLSYFLIINLLLYFLILFWDYLIIVIGAKLEKEYPLVYWTLCCLLRQSYAEGYW